MEEVLEYAAAGVSAIVQPLWAYLDDAAQSVSAAAPRTAASAVVVVLTWLAIRIARRAVEQIAKRAHMRRNLTEVFARAFGSTSIDFEIAWWTGSRPIDIRASRDQVVRAVKSALDDADIEIPFPYRTLTFQHPADAEALSPD